jgi:hypothetical protein
MMWRAGKFRIIFLIWTGYLTKINSHFEQEQENSLDFFHLDDF